MKGKCDRCGLIAELEKHHKKHKVAGGSDAPPNRRWLCTACHDYKHAKDTVLQAIKAEEARLSVLRRRLAIIEAENTPDKIIERGYQSYFEIYDETLPAKTKCGRV